MLFFSKQTYLEESDRLWYHKVRFVLYTLAFLVFVLFWVRTTFPRISFVFDFDNPQSSKNELFSVTNESLEPIEKGKLRPENRLIAYGAFVNPVSNIDVYYQPTEKDDHDYTGLTAEFKRGFAATFAPLGSPITAFDQTGNLFVSDKTYYLRNGEQLQPFVSEAAFRSRYPVELAQRVDESFLRNYQIAPEFIGFRPGTLVAYADGVFVVTNEGTVRPFGSPEIFLGYGYTFDDVQYVDAEELGIYQRGRIIQFGGLHPDGALFYDTDTETSFLYENNRLQPIQNPDVLDYLKTQQTPIDFSSTKQLQPVSCVLAKQLLHKRYICQVTASGFTGPGFDYQVTLINKDTEKDLRRMQVGFQVSRSPENVIASIRTFRQLISQRIGL